jgi:hypothetical protein
MAFGFLLAACTSPPSVPKMEFPIAQAASAPSPRVPAPSELNIRLLPDRSVPLDWLELDRFFPPGARRVGPHLVEALKLAADNRMRFPTAEVYESPDQAYSLFHDGVKRSRTQITHWLMMYRKNADFPNAIFSTTASFDASWSPDSTLFAVTHYVGHNSSEVFVCSTSLFKETVDIRPWVREFFPPHFIEASIFVKAYRWTADGVLVVRAVGRSWIEPYELFGFEIAVRVAPNARHVESRYLRGFIRE